MHCLIPTPLTISVISSNAIHKYEIVNLQCLHKAFLLIVFISIIRCEMELNIKEMWIELLYKYCLIVHSKWWITSRIWSLGKFSLDSQDHLAAEILPVEYRYNCISILFRNLVMFKVTFWYHFFKCALQFKIRSTSGTVFILFWISMGSLNSQLFTVLLRMFH